PIMTGRTYPSSDAGGGSPTNAFSRVNSFFSYRMLVPFCVLYTQHCALEPVHAASKDKDVIEDVNGKEMQKLIEEKDYVAVIQDKRAAKLHGITNFPHLVYYRNKEPATFEGDLENEEQVLEFLTSLDAMDSPDRIEEVNAKILDKIVKEEDYVAVLFYAPDCRKCEKALRELENIDDEADELGIAFVKINDDELADEYNLDVLPSLVYYRNQIPIVFDGDLTKEEEVLEWIIGNKSTGDEDDDNEIESVSAKALWTLVESVDHLAVLFVDQSALSEVVLHRRRVRPPKHPVREDGRQEGQPRTGIDDIPAVVYYENNIPNVFDGDLRDEQEVLRWLLHQKESDEIEDVTSEMLDRLIRETKHLAVLFYDEDGDESEAVLAELENIDDECDAKGIAFVKIDDIKEAAEYGIEETPTLVYFENSIPSIFDGDLKKEDQVLKWLTEQMESDEIEEVTDEMLNMLINQNQQLGVVFYDRDQRKSQKIIEELENIDDECDKHGIIFVKISDQTKVNELGIGTPSLIYFENRIPHLYEGDLSDEEATLNWLLHQLRSDEIEEVTDEMLDILIERHQFVAALFYDKDDKDSLKALQELENIDDECDAHGIVFVKIDDDAEAKEYGFDELPVLVYFEDKVPSLYEGDLDNEEEVLKWLVHQKTHDTIEEVTDEMLQKLVGTHQYVAVYFSGPCVEEEGADDPSNCDEILDELESIDDDVDEAGIIMVTTEETTFAIKTLGIKIFPALVLFRNEDPLIFDGELTDEDEVLSWLTDDDSLELPDRIEEVNLKMLQRLLDTTENVVVYFYRDTDKKSVRILQELENIDDEADAANIAFVKISDDSMLREYDLDPLPTLVYFREKFPMIFPGDLSREETVLDWVMKLKEAPRDTIEEVDHRTLRMLLDELDHVAVLFHEENCPECDDILKELEKIDDEADDVGIHFVRTEDTSVAEEELRIKDFPTLVYYQGGAPSIYRGSLDDEDEVLGWMRRIYIISEGLRLEVSRRRSATEDKTDCSDCENYCRKKYGESTEDEDEEEEDDDDEEEVSDEDEDSEEYIAPEEKARRERKLDIDNLKTLPKKKKSNSVIGKVVSKILKLFAFYRHRDLVEEGEVLHWLVYQRKFEALPELTRADLDDLIGDSDYLAVVFFSNYTDEDSARTLRRASLIAEDAAAFGIPIAKMPDVLMAKKYGIRDHLVLYYSVEYDDDLEDEEEMLDWLTSPENMILKDQIEVVNRKMLDRMRENTAHLAVLFFSETDCKQCERVVSALEEIDDDADQNGIAFVRIDDWELAKGWGVHALPALVYFSIGAEEPVIFAGDLRSPQKIMEWLLNRKDPGGVTIEEVTSDEVAKLPCRACDTILMELEKIDDECDTYGIHMVKIADPQLAKRYGIHTFPALVYFRNGNPLLYEGELKNEDADDEEECGEECENILLGLEEIDDEADGYGIDMVKVVDGDDASEFNIMTTPAMVYFRRGTALIYEGDLMDTAAILGWLTSNEAFELKDEIEEVNRRMLEKLLDDNDFVTVFFFDSEDCSKCGEILEDLERVDAEADNLDIIFVRIDDVKYAKKWGVTKIPALVYFRRKFPSIYRGDMTDETAVLDWLQKNRYKQPELSLFVFAIATMGLCFVLYTIFILVFLKHPSGGGESEGGAGTSQRGR
ncbi:putative protein disulfide-isomerase C1F5.02, partial [Orchesella cincta]